MLINASHSEENRVVIVVDGILSELDIELAGQQQTKGNIYKAVVTRVEPGLQAAFVDYGAERHGFLQTGEIHPDLYPAKKPDSKERPRINDILRRGQEILVQVVKGERGTKGAALTTFLSLPGRYMVLMPDSDTKGVSRKIQDDKERKALKKTMAQLDLPEEMGYIVRTAGIGKEESELKRDFNYLVSLHKGILARREKVKAPAQLYQESDIVIRSIRDYFAIDMDEVLIDDAQVYQQARDFFSLVMPEQLHLVKRHREKRPIFSRYQIEEQIEALARNQVPLPSGGSIVLDQTEALVAIDVNSGRMAGEKGIEATAARSNIEAAAEIGRQLRLRDLGGLVVIDFIDMRDRKKVREVEQTMRASIKDDKARITIGRISQFGLMEMSRQRIRPTLSVGAYLDCPHCHGKGRIKSPEAQAVALLRQLHASVSKGHIGTIEAKVPLDVANYLLNKHRQTLSELEQRFELKIHIYGTLDAIPEQIELELIKREKNQSAETEQVPVSHSVGLEEALAAANAPEEEKETTPKEETTDTEAATEGSPSRRRRRGRRKRRSGSSNTQQANEQSGENAEKQAEESSDPAAVDTATTDQTKSDTTAADPAPATEASVEGSDTSTEKPKRRRRRPAAKKAIESAPESSTEAAAQIEKSVTEGTTETTAPVDDKPKRRRRRPSAKKATPPATEGTTEVAAPVEKPATDGTAETPVPADDKPKRRRRRPAAKKPTEPATESAPEVVAPIEKPASEGSPEVAAPVEEKPKRRSRRPAAKKASEPVSDDTTLAAAPTEEKPKRRPRRPAAKKTTETVTEVTTSEPASVEEKPKRQTRKPSAKKVTPPTIEDKSETVASDAEKPKRRARKPAVKKVDD